MSGSGPCNRFSGSYELNGKALKFGKVATTLMACIQGMDIETKFSQALQATTRFDLRGQILDLNDASGNLVARFESQAGH
jgi:heat shock protein HslJ